LKIGVLALQGALIEHSTILQGLGIESPLVRLPAELDGLDGLIIPGGESTTVLKLMQSFDFLQPLREFARAGFPVWGTCAGMICLAKKISDSNMDTLALMDIVVRRNAFERQIDSFETELPIPALGDKPFPGIFIRAPIIEEAGPQVEILAELPNGTAIAARQGKLLVSAFHPELSPDLRFHSYFSKIVDSH
jgi:5'-phosphate synthase pdxT subunit